MAALAQRTPSTSTAELYENAKKVVKQAAFKITHLDTSPNNKQFMRFVGILAKAQHVFVLVHKPQPHVLSFEVTPGATTAIRRILFLHCQNEKSRTPYYSLQTIHRMNVQRFFCSICKMMCCYTVDDLVRHKAACNKRWSMTTKKKGSLPSSQMRYFPGRRVETKQTLKRRLTTLGVPTKFCALFDDGWSF